MSRRWTDADLKTIRRAVAADIPKPKKTFRSQLEAEYAGTLELRKRAGEITDFGYERVTLVLPGQIRYTADFDCVLPDGHIELHEVKGWMRPLANAKLKAAIATYPHVQWFIAGTEGRVTRLRRPQDVPPASRVVR